MKLVRAVLVWTVCFGLAACSDEEPQVAQETPAAKPVPLEPLPPLRTGTTPLIQGEAMVATLKSSFKDATHEYLEVLLPASVNLSGIDRQHVELDGALPGELAFIELGQDSIETRVLVRRPLSDGRANPGGAVFVSRWGEGVPNWQRLPFTSKGQPAAATQALATRWLTAFSSQFSQGVPGSIGSFGDFTSSPHPWDRFAAARVLSLIPEGERPEKPTDGGQGWKVPRTDLAQLMETTSGMQSVQEALQYDRGLRLDRTPAKRDIAVDTLAGPALVAHPFAAMQAKLPAPMGGTPEPLAAAVPAAFWYLRVDDIRVLLRLLDEADAWITPVVQILDRSPEDRRLSARYQAQLGLKRSGLAKLLGNTVVGPVAVVGSDPYLREGSDVTLIFTVKQQSIFDAELARHLAEYKNTYAGLATTTRDHAGVLVGVSRDAAGHVRQQRAQVGELAIVSNSAGACDRVIDAIQGKAPRLGDEPDLKFLLARDPGAHQVFAFLSDRFIGNVVAPQQKVLAARREQALAELLTPGYAALLYGWLNGQLPASTDALIASGLLSKDELKHADGAAIAFAPDAAASSVWGTPAALTPLIDLPAVTVVSAAEKTAYDSFVSTYQQYWRQYIDPVAIRLDLAEAADGTAATIDVRILPLISATEYNEIEAIVGTTHVDVPTLERGLQAVWAIGPQASLRSELDGALHSMSGQPDIGLGWLGNWVALGLDDRATLVELLSKFDHSVQRPFSKTDTPEFEDVDLWQRIGKFPIYALAEVKNPVLLVATLAAVRTMIGQVAPGMTEWGEADKYRDIPIVRIGMAKNSPMLPKPEIANAIALHYAQAGGAFVLALNVETLHTVIDRLLDAHSPKSVDAGSAQFVIDARSRPGAPLWTALLWLIQGQANEAEVAARRPAEILLRGDPGAAQDPARFAAHALDWFGYVPLTAQGDSSFVLYPHGAGDSVSGSTLTPTWVDLPIPGSPVAQLMERLTGARAEVGFDNEPHPTDPRSRSLHTRVALQLGKEAVQ